MFPPQAPLPPPPPSVQSRPPELPSELPPPTSEHLSMADQVEGALREGRPDLFAELEASKSVRPFCLRMAASVLRLKQTLVERSALPPDVAESEAFREIVVP